MTPANYLCKPIYNQKELLVSAKKYLKKLEPYDAIVGIGLSGALAVPLIAFRLKKRFCIIRKKQHSSHSDETLEGNMLSEDSWVFVDDSISSGRTFTRVCHHMREYPKCRGMYLYYSDEILTSDKVGLGEGTLSWVSPEVIKRAQNRLRRFNNEKSTAR